MSTTATHPARSTAGGLTAADRVAVRDALPSLAAEVARKVTGGADAAKAGAILDALYALAASIGEPRELVTAAYEEAEYDAREAASVRAAERRPAPKPAVPKPDRRVAIVTGRRDRPAVPAAAPTAAPVAVPDDARPLEAEGAPVRRTVADVRDAYAAVVENEPGLTDERRAALVAPLNVVAPRASAVARAFQSVGGWVPWDSPLADVLWADARKSALSRDALRPAMWRADAVNGHARSVFTDGHVLIIGPGAGALDAESREVVRKQFARAAGPSDRVLPHDAARATSFDAAWASIEGEAYPSWRAVVPDVRYTTYHAATPAGLFLQSTFDVRGSVAPPRVYTFASAGVRTASEGNAWDGWAAFSLYYVAAVARYTVPGAAASGALRADVARLALTTTGQSLACRVSYADPAEQAVHAERYGVDIAALLMPLIRDRYNPASDAAGTPDGQTALFDTAGERTNPDGLAVACLGRAVELRVAGRRGHVVRYADPDGDTLLVWLPEMSRLLLVPREHARTATAAAQSDSRRGDALAVFEQWQHDDPDGRALALDLPAEALALRLPREARVGTGQSIRYLSDKRMEPGDAPGEHHGYHHDFHSGRRAVHEIHYPAGGPPVLAVSGIVVTGRGILN